MKLQRDQVVAASLVGTVVVVLGFASGIGQVPRAQGGPVQAQTPSTSPTPVEQPHHPPADQMPVARNPVPVAHQPAAPHVPAPTHPHPSAPPGTTKPPTTTPPTTTPSTPDEPCDADVLTKLLRDVGLLVGELPVVGELTDGTKAVDEVPLLGLSLLPPLKLPGGCQVVLDEKTGRVTGLLDAP
jgi:hypothetical protein